MVKPKTKEFFKKWTRRLGYCLASMAFLLVILEIFYRNQWIDTYKRELNALNPAPFPQNPRKKVLVMGDSFSAAPNSWVNLLRTQHPDWQIVNSAVPGTTIFQANLMLENRLSRFKPDLLIYQIYVGNDLFDLRYPVHWGKVGWGRNLYWWAANRVRSLAWLNYALGQLKRSTAMPDFEQGKVNEGEFDPMKFSERERLYLKAEPGLIADQVMLRGERKGDWEQYERYMSQFLTKANQFRCPVVIVVIPHCAQVTVRYAQRMARLGATGLGDAALRAPGYPFLQHLDAYKAVDVKVLNLLPALKNEEMQGSPMYYLHDAHLNDLGQAIVAKHVDSLASQFVNPL